MRILTVDWGKRSIKNPKSYLLQTQWNFAKCSRNY